MKNLHCFTLGVSKRGSVAVGLPMIVLNDFTTFDMYYITKNNNAIRC